jgi:periplasmic copper chaperone A
MKLITTLALVCLCTSAVAQTKPVTVTEPWLRATVAAQKVTGGYMQLTATSDARLLSVRSPVTSVIEIHEMAMDKDVMTMRALPKGLALPAGKTVELKPGGYHLMFLDLRNTLRAGDTVPMTLVIEDKAGKTSELSITATVKPLGSTAATPAAAHSH